MCSFDARSERQSGRSLKLVEGEKVWVWTEGAGNHPSCSQSPHDKKDGKDTHVGPVLPERAP